MYDVTKVLAYALLAMVVLYRPVPGVIFCFLILFVWYCRGLVLFCVLIFPQHAVNFYAPSSKQGTNDHMVTLNSAKRFIQGIGKCPR